jgi:death on curing protein
MAGVTNPGLIDSAISRPYNGYYRSLAKKAAALLQSMAGNHGFADGNKRTTVILVDMLISKSGYRLVPNYPSESIDAAIEETVMKVVIHQLNFEELCKWFETRLVRDS